MRILYLDCFSGISGDMLLSSLLDLGVSKKWVQESLQGIPFAPFRLKVQNVKQHFMRAKRVSVVVKEGVHSYQEIKRRIARAALPPWVKEKGLKSFEWLAEAEAKVHGESKSALHFHEVGQNDALVDVLGSLLALHSLRVGKVLVSPVNLGSGRVTFSHGASPVPAPAVLELLKGFPVYQERGERGASELATPTGAALLKTVAEPSLEMPLMQVEKIGYGAGSRSPSSGDGAHQEHNLPNVLRAILGTQFGQKRSGILQLTTVVDDLPAQVLAADLELLRPLTLDIYQRSVAMKKGRWGVEIVLLCEKEKEREVLAGLLPLTSIGVRRECIERIQAPRELYTVKSSLGPVRVKRVCFEEKSRLIPELDDCLDIARRKKLSVAEVYSQVLREANGVRSSNFT